MASEERARYDEVADWYDAVVREGTIVQDAAIATITRLAGDVAGRRVLDLACGQGIVARAMAQRGASVLGVDISEKLLDLARREETALPLGIEFRDLNAEDLTQLPDGSFDGVVCNMALMDIADLAAVFRGVSRTLRSGGWFVFSIMHPCFQTPNSRWHVSERGEPGRLVSDYFNESLWYSADSVGMRSRVGAHHRMLSTYLNEMVLAGFQMEACDEPYISREHGMTEPAYDLAPALLCVRSVTRADADRGDAPTSQS